MAKVGAFRFWCQKVLPLVYDDSISYYELLNKMVVYLNNVISDFNTVAENFDNLDDAFDTLQGSFNDTKNAMLHAYDQLQGYVNNYFDNLDVQEEINNKLDEMAEDGSLSELLEPFITTQISADVAAWLQQHITPTSPAVDSSLTVAGAAADAKATGDMISDLGDKISILEPAASVSDVGKFLKVKTVSDGKVAEYDFAAAGGALSADVKSALLACFEKVAWIDGNGQDYYDALETALYPPAGLNYITAVYTQTGYVYDTDSLNSLKSDLVVTAYYEDGHAEAINNYTLSGTLTIGNSIITVAFGGKTATFSVTVVKNTAPRIAQSGYCLVFSSGYTNAHPEPMENGGITIKYALAEPTTILHPAGVIVQDIFAQNRGCLAIYNNGTYVNYLDEVNRWGQLPAASHIEYNNRSWNVEAYNQIEFSIDIRYIDDSYMYDYTTGNIWFAGKNTRYYGMNNISEAQ